jgi:hypothetical protein
LAPLAVHHRVCQLLLLVGAALEVVVRVSAFSVVMSMIAAGPISASASTLKVFFALDDLCGFLSGFVILSVHEVRLVFALRQFLVKV